MRNSTPQLNLNFQYQEYLKRVRISESEMTDVQRVETKRAFYGAFGQALLCFRDDLADDEDDAVEELQNMLDQVIDFWQRESA